MSNVLLESNTNGNTLFLYGEINGILDNRRSSRYLKDNLSFLAHENCIEIDASQDVNKAIDRIKKVCELASCELEFSSNVSGQINNYLNEENKFISFSEKARLIRDNNCNPKDFKVFEEGVSVSLTNRSLYPLQLLSAYHLAFSQNACNFSVPGAGKTSIVYGAFAYLSHLKASDSKYVDKLLVIGPLNSFGPWEKEYTQCFGSIPSSTRISGGIPLEERKQYFYSLTPSLITLISYASVSTVLEELIYFLKTYNVMVVLDEAHKIKNTAGGKAANSVLEIAKYCKSRVVLTGTPAPNGYEDLYNLYKFIWPTKKIIPFETHQLKDMSKTTDDPRTNVLIRSIEPFFIRIKKSDLGIPPAIEHEPILVPMGETQRRIYDVLEKRFLGEIITKRDNAFRQDLIKARLIRLMQASTNPSLLKIPLKNFALQEGFDADVVSEDTSFINDITNYAETEIPNKFIEALRIIKEIVNRKEKVVVWATFISNILLFQQYLLENGLNSKTLYGATPVSNGEDDTTEAETREKIIDQFNEPDSPFSIIIANPFAVSESISLHKACHNAIYLERTFNAAHFIQSKDRIHRYGLSPGTVTNYYYLLSENSIDSTIHERLLEKENRLREIMESMPIPLFSNIDLMAGDDDMRALIKEYVERTNKM